MINHHLRIQLPQFLFYGLLIHSSSSWTTSRGRLGCPTKPSTFRLYNGKGFAKSTSTADGNDRNQNAANQTPPDVQPIYSQPALYDLAFGYRGFEEEVAFLRQRHVDVTGQAPTRILEVAAGPARHALTALAVQYDNDDDDDDDKTKAVQAVYCIDNSPEMRDYALDICQHELPVDAQEKFHYQVADMRNFTLSNGGSNHNVDSHGAPVQIDTAWLLLGSMQHMTTNDDVRQCLSAIHRSLVSNGTLILELPHPRETFSMVECTRNGWKVPLEDEDGAESGELAIVWGDDDDAFDPLTQVRQFTVRMTLRESNDGAITTRLAEVVPLRLFTAQEMEALATATGFTVASYHGALEEGVSVHNDDAAYRLVVVLQKTEKQV